MKIESVKISQLKANPNNPRIIKDDKFEKLVRSIKDFPKMLEIRPIVVNDDMIVLGGNMRLKACKEAGLKEVPVIKASDLTEDEQRQFIIKDNVSGGEWEWEMLANDWDIEQLEEWGLDMPDDWVQDEVLEAEEDDFDATPPEEPITVLGDLYEIGEHRLLCGDSTDSDQVAKLMNGEKADMVMTDPPYNVAYEGGTGLTIMNDEMDNDSFYTFLFLFYKAFSEVTKQGGAWYVWHADSEGVNFRKAFTESGLLLKQCLIWVKNALVMGRQDYHWKHEPCLYGWKEGAGHYFTDDRTKTTVIEDKLDIKKLKKDELVKLLSEVMSDKTKSTIIHHDKPLKNTEHPTMKPILLLAPLIENSSKTGWLVADPFLGSGSTMVASHQLKRKCYGMELDPKYCDVIIKRMINLDPSIEIKRNGQKINNNEFTKD
jgi:site-specific DNA-methyltransferase (adenine-specific)